MKTENIFKKAFNDALDILAEIEVGQVLPTENQLAAQMEISRTTVRKVLVAFAERGLVSSGLPRLKLHSKAPAWERYPDADTVPSDAVYVVALRRGMKA